MPIGTIQEIPSEYQINGHIVEFTVQHREYLMFFTPKCDFDDLYTKDHLGFDVKFDLKANFENETYFAPPSGGPLRRRDALLLGKLITNILDKHCVYTGAQRYFFTAETTGLEKLYDRLVKDEADKLNFVVRKSYCEEGPYYEACTPNAKSFY